MQHQSKKYFVDNELSSYYGDKQLLELLKYDKDGKFKCVYCCKEANSREHIPSKIFLDKPYGTNLAILPSCIECNNSYSGDEQYLACLVDYVQYKLSDFKTVKRSKIQKTFNSRPHIESEFENSTKYADDGSIDYIEFNLDRIKHVLLKLSLGHAIYSLSCTNLGKPDTMFYKFATQMTQEEVNNFNLEPIDQISPEIGSREGTYVSVLSDGTPIFTWKIIQDNQYRFLAYHGTNSINIKIVIGEYFFSEVIWNQ